MLLYLEKNKKYTFLHHLIDNFENRSGDYRDRGACFEVGGGGGGQDSRELFHAGRLDFMW